MEIDADIPESTVPTLARKVQMSVLADALHNGC